MLTKTVMALAATLSLLWIPDASAACRSVVAPLGITVQFIGERTKQPSDLTNGQFVQYYRTELNQWRVPWAFVSPVNMGRATSVRLGVGPIFVAIISVPLPTPLTQATTPTATNFPQPAP